MAVNTNEFTLAVGVTLDTKSIQAQLNSVSDSQKTIKVKVEADGSNLNKVSKSAKDVTTDLNKASKSAVTFGSKMVDIGKKVLAFGLITDVIQAFTGAVRDAIDVVFNFDEVLTEFRKVSEVGGNELDNYTKKLGELGLAVARTRSEMVSASTEFVKSGYTEEESAQLAQVASLYQNIADSEISAGESASLIISQMKAFDIEAENAVDIINEINEVDILAFPFGNIRVIKDNYIGQSLGIEETEERRIDIFIKSNP